MYPLILGALGIGAAVIYAMTRKSSPKPGTTLASTPVGQKTGFSDTSASQVVQKVSRKVDIPDESTFARVEYNGDTYLVSRDYVPHVTIGEAMKLARDNGYELPSPGLADAIWRAADMKVMPHPMAHDGTFKGMNSDDIVNRFQAAIDAQIQERGGSDYKLLAGSHKDVAYDPKTGKHGIYGWHITDAEIPEFKKKNPGVPVQLAVTPNLGAHVVQDFPSHHDDSWGDYSQGARLTRKITQQA